MHCLITLLALGACRLSGGIAEEPLDLDGDGALAYDDCDDNDPTRAPGAAETCDGIDNDCDDLVDEDAVDAPAWHPDRDGDGFGAATGTTSACAAPEGYLADDTDCDDARDDVHPGAPERCDHRDDDCDGDIDEDAVDQTSYYADLDGDGFGAGEALYACDPPPEAADNDLDCDDARDDISPAQPERCDGLDDDCDGTADEDALDALPWFYDEDGDGYGAGEPTLACDLPLRTVADATDCDDGASAIHPGAEERCDGLDNNCNGVTDLDAASPPSPWYADADGDGFGAGAQVLACGAPAGHVSTPGDCDDAHGAVNPDATEVCDGLDNDCDGIIDLDTASPPTWYRDADQDGFGDEAFPIQACDAPLGYRGAAGDCDDLDPEIRPDSPPGCDDRDHNCDGEIDHDADGDGFSDGYCGGSDWDDADPTCAADCADGLSVHSPAESCQDLFTRSPEGADGLYWVDPLSSGEPLQVWCHLSAGGWTLIASQPALWPDDMALHLDEVVPEPSVQGALGLYFQTDLRELGNELWVVNDRGEEAVFLLDDFTGPLVFDAPNWVDAADTSWSGIIAGSAYPVITHFQVGQACTAADCHKAIGSSSSYTNGLAVILDWHNGDTTTSLSSHAHFGGTATIERGWASRGVALYLR